MARREVRHPVRQYLDDSVALASTNGLPRAVVERIVDDRVDTASWWPGRTSVDTDRQKVSITTPRMRKTLRRIEKFTLTSK